MADDPTDRIVQEILAPDGRVPAERLADITLALAQRTMSADADAVVRWRIRLDIDGREVVCDEDDYPLATLSKVEKRLGKTWHHIAPGRSATDSVELIRGLLEDSEGMTPEDADKALKGLTVSDVLDRFEEYTRAAGPFGGSAPPTS